MNHRLYIEQPPFAPWLGFCEALFACRTVALYDNVQYEDGGFQNRNRIKTPDGVRWLTVPVVKNHGQLIKDVRIADTFDPQGMLRRMRLAYGRSRHLDEVLQILAPPLAAGHRWLLDLNLELTTGLAVALGAPADLTLTSRLPIDPEADRTGRIVRICRAAGADELWAGSGTRGYLDPADLAADGIAVTWTEYLPRHPAYEQAWPQQGFAPNLSVLDVASAIGWAGTSALLRSGLATYLDSLQQEGQPA
ncbi:WbqC family protein [Kitasatospora sp. NPDC028055]|uniref:WbqC family protein n=1 Tax=Kitasatospora sp. NPDC028055 TaxID=3155653 RepID=UPI0033C65BDA